MACAAMSGLPGDKIPRFCHPCVRAGQLIFGAGEGIRTLDPNLGKVVLYH
jgi:hypothetical protein